MGGKNYKKGAGFESRWLNSLLQSGEAVRGARFFKSRGPRWTQDYTRMNDNGTDWAWRYAPVDVWWMDREGKYYEDQCKYGTNNVGKIPPDEFLDLVEYADEHPDIIVRLVSKESGKRYTHVWTFNVERPALPY